VVKNKWELKIEQKSDGSIHKYKVAKGFDQENDSDFHETFSPLIKPTIIRLVLALAVHHSCLFIN
jgi:histone deacetylase 1/2